MAFKTMFFAEESRENFPKRVEKINYRWNKFDGSIGEYINVIKIWKDLQRFNAEGSYFDKFLEKNNKELFEMI